MSEKYKDFYKYLDRLKIATVITMCIIMIILLCSPALITHAENENYDKDFNSCVTYNYSYKKGFDTKSYSYDYKYRIRTNGKLVCVTYYSKVKAMSDNEVDCEGFAKFYISTSPIYYTQLVQSSVEINGQEGLAPTYNNVYYVNAGSYWGSISADSFSSTIDGLVNIKNRTSSDWLQFLKDDIDNNVFDLTKDDYQDTNQKEESAVYDSSLDLTELGGKFNNTLWTTSEENADGSFIKLHTPSDFNLETWWNYKDGFDVKGSYIKFTFYGNVYTGFFKTKKTWTSVSYSDIERISKEHKFYFTELYEKACETIGVGSGDFLPDYAYVQCFGEIENEFCKSRIYRMNFHDENEIPIDVELTEAMPDDYVPDSKDPNPSATAPSPVIGDDIGFNSSSVSSSLVPNLPDDGNILTGLQWLLSVLKGLTASLGDFPMLVNNVFGFLPSSVIVLIGVSIVAIIVLRFIGR